MNWGNKGYYKIAEWNDDHSSTWKWQLDHIIPQKCFWFSFIDNEVFRKCWALDNIRPLSAKENCQKNRKIVW